MMKGKTLLCIALIMSISFGVFMTSSVGAQATTMGVEPQGVVDHGLGAASTFTVEIWIRNVVDLAGPEFKLGYDTNVLTADWIEYGGIFGATFFFLINATHDAEGYCHYSIMEAFGEPSFNGSGRLATVHFSVDAAGDSALNLYDTKLGDSNALPISHEIIDGYFSNVHMWLRSEGGLIDLANPVGTDWHALLPGYCNTYEITGWPNDNDNSGTLSICDNIQLKNKTTAAVATYGVEEVTVSLNMTWSEVRIDVNSPSSTSGGWTTGDGAYADGGTSASITSAKPSASQYYGGYGFNIPTGSTINQVKVRLDAWGGNEYLYLQVSEDGGSTWLATQWGPTELTGTEATYWADVTGWTSWTPAKINNDNIRTEVWCHTQGGSSTVYLDWIPINVTYTAVLPMYGVAFEGAESTNSPSSTSTPSGTWSNPTNAYSSDNSYASTSTASAAQQYGSYGFSLPGGATIVGVYVGYEAYTAGDDGIRISCSWDGGTTWATEHVNDTLATSDPNAVTWADFTLATSWTATKLNDANFLAKASYQYAGGQSTTYLDWLPVRVAIIDSPSSTSAVVAGWSNPTNAYSSDNSYASTNTPNATQQYGNYGFSLPGGATIVKVEVGIEANRTGYNDMINLTCSWDGGTSWATEQQATYLPKKDPNLAYWFDFTGATSWTATKLNDANFRTRAIYCNVTTPSMICLDWIPVRVTFTGSPSSTSAVVAGWSNPTNAYSSDNSYASTSTASAAQQYGSYGFSLPGGATIVKVEVGIEAYTAGDDGIRISCSWDGGTTWATEHVVASLATSDPNAVTWVDFTAATSWTATKLNNANFLAKASYQYAGGQSTTYLDWIPVRVYYDLLIPDFNWANPLNYQWHETYPVFSNRYNLTSWTDNSPSGLGPGDVIQLKNTATGVVRSCTVTGNSTLIIVTKIAHPGIPEFPLGSVLPIALIVAVIYVWWINKRKRITKPQ